MEKLERGLVQIYTGDNKGKTTAALGLTLRAVGHGFHVFILQFMKGRQDYGELQGLKRLEPECQIEQFGLPGWVHKGQAKEADCLEALKGLERARELITSGEWDIVILDEIINAIWFELIPEELVLDLLEAKPGHVEIIMTGRNASSTLIDKAHLVTEMVSIKHPYELGIQARKGIEY
ncbi:cob(I)alamin adenosyltransferase [Desulfitobacterium dichloroeliminans LMG P-21439]|uniref:Cob(I)alamin adenosyltransferase n=1 Tax=Desulfitobacterium dichloroeliminans (strain LMG P-21439 / DCA1) TaxID=871963 RepID=L0FA62_DESDL|nr:cob(I)yrinic acid a,c-diamide adenosyltransferase [Desulfitobacterium dichloroeliminans]AGA69526.1 cob(I)alamin adenosyltransferase [Desulfitobacterium dichloroeliminans LMG P-21439]